MKRESIIVLLEVLIPAFTCFIYMVWVVCRDLLGEREWRSSLQRDELLKLEETLGECMKKYGVFPKDQIPIEQTIEDQGYRIQRRFWLYKKDGYTTQLPDQDVYVRSFLSAPKRNFVLTHELMHIIYMPEELNESPQGHRPRSFFGKKDKREQERDYMAACYIMPRDKFWSEIQDANYFGLDFKERKSFIYRTAQKYNVEPSTVFRRISELNVIMQQ